MTDELKQWEYDKGYTKGYSDGRASLIEELENIKDEVIRDAYMMFDYNKEKSVITVDELCKIIHRRIYKLKGENK